MFGVAIRKDIILDCVRYHRLKSKQPYKTKRKSEIRGSNKKPHAQKGTGRAQAGHKRNAIWLADTILYIYINIFQCSEHVYE